MRKIARRILPVALVASMVGFGIAATTSTTTIQSTAKLVPIATGITPKIPPTATATVVYQKVTVVQNGTTFPSNKTLSATVKGLTPFADNGYVFFEIGGKEIGYAEITNGSGKMLVNQSTGYTYEPIPDVISGTEIIGAGWNGKHYAGKTIFTGVFGPLSTTTK